MKQLNEYDYKSYDQYERYEDYERAKTTRNKPRTKRRPIYKKVAKALVVGVNRGKYDLLLDSVGSISNSDDIIASNPLKNMQYNYIVGIRSRELSKKSIVCGDYVDVDISKVSQNEQQGQALYRMVNLHERKSFLRRTISDENSIERPLAANVEQAIITVSASEPTPNVNFINRCIESCVDGKVTPIVCFTKTDLATVEELGEYYSEQEILSATTSIDGNETVNNIDLLKLLEGKKSVFIGESGVGKSTLINSIIPNANRATNETNAVTGKGRHTSSSSRMYVVDKNVFVSIEDSSSQYSDSKNTFIIDTPGVRSWGTAF